MKKKLQLNDLKVKSFVTSDDASQIMGGSIGETNYSCLKFISCDIVGCAASKYNNCPTTTVNGSALCLE